jgi:diguanylate cyclase (GGDEF)-like protein
MQVSATELSHDFEMPNATWRTVIQALDQLEVAGCVFDAHDRAVLWNYTFLRLFPEHAGHIHVGEHYSENLRRFYRERLAPDEAPFLEHYVADGVQRHLTQQQAFEFDHRGYRVRVASLPLPEHGRVRMWRKTTLLSAVGDDDSKVTVADTGVSAAVADALESLADGALVVNKAGTTLWANRRFFEIYGLLPSADLMGHGLADIYTAAWRDHKPTEQFSNGLHALKERQRFAGAPYELPLPGQRWVRVVEQMGERADGRGYSTHADITALKRQQDELERLTVSLESLAVTDALTGLANRRRFDEGLELEWLRARRDSLPLSLIMIDVDHFKHINDAHGHPCGDSVLQAIARELTQHVRRASDLVARYGGEEFAVLLPNTDLATAYVFAERLRETIQLTSLGAANNAFSITVSCGVSCALPESLHGNRAWLVQEADTALYEAKRSGRNKVVCR